MTDGVRRPLAGRLTSAASRRRRPVDRAISTLEAVAEAVDGLRLSELARRTGVPKTSTGRVLGDLLATGMVVRERGYYMPGPRMLTMAARVSGPNSAMLLRLLLPYAVTLYDETGLNAAFGVMRYGKVRFETALYGLAYSTVFTPLPRWSPAHCTATGKVMLAYRDKRVPPTLTRYTGATITNPEVLAAELEKIRRTGIATSRDEYVAGITSLAVPVLGRQSRPVGALAVCGQPDEVDPRAATSALRRVARAANTAARTLG